MLFIGLFVFFVFFERWGLTVLGIVSCVVVVRVWLYLWVPFFVQLQDLGVGDPAIVEWGFPGRPCWCCRWGRWELGLFGWLFICFQVPVGVIDVVVFDSVVVACDADIGSVTIPSLVFMVGGAWWDAGGLCLSVESRDGCKAVVVRVRIVCRGVSVGPFASSIVTC